MTRSWIPATALVLLAACGGADRPSVAEWQPVWDGAIAAIPTAEELGEPPDRAICSGTLGFLRSTEGDLLPTPDDAIDEPVREWFEVAKNAFFECPPTSSPNPGMDYAYGQLARLEAEVAAVVAIDS